MGHKEKMKETKELSKILALRCQKELTEKESILKYYSALLDLFSSIEIKNVNHREIRRMNGMFIRNTWATVGRNIREAMVQYGKR